MAKSSSEIITFGMHKPLLFALLVCLTAGSCTAADLVAGQVFARLQPLGYERHWWRMEDFRLYRLYWHLAPAHGWPRWPLTVSFGCFLGCGAALAFLICW
jgi:hypothetical protein